MFRILSPTAVEEAYHRIKNHVINTPIIQSIELNNMLSHKVYFKLENQQNLGSFKIRGALNALLKLKEQNKLPYKIVAFSSGNHAKSVAYAAQILGVKAVIVMPQNVENSKIKSLSEFDIKLIITQTRQQAEDLVQEIVYKENAYYLPPSDDDMVIAGNGTVCYEALLEINKLDAVFAPCGGGGLVSGSYLASKLFNKNVKIFGVEPSSANDASNSVKQGSIFRFKDSPKTIADGARTLGITERIFHYLKQIDGFFDITENEILQSMLDVNQIFGIMIEPTAALSLAAAYRWLRSQKTRREVLVILTGGNIEKTSYEMMINEFKNKKTIKYLTA